MSTYCAPCLADLALLREAVTTVSGTASCVAHAVLLLHPADTAQQRLARLSELRSTAEGKIATASADDVPALELLVQEYALAGAMDMTVPLRDLAGDRTPRPEGAAKKRRNRGRDRERGPRPADAAGSPSETAGEQAPSSAPSSSPSPSPSPSAPASSDVPSSEASVEAAPSEPVADRPAEAAAPSAESAPAEPAAPAAESAPAAPPTAPPTAPPAAPPAPADEVPTA